MKTPEELKQRIREMVDPFLDCELMKEKAVETGLLNGINTVIAEIQRDAREGMVPESDFQPLIDCVMLYDSGGIAEELATLRAKHPNLFTK